MSSAQPPPALRWPVSTPTWPSAAGLALLLAAAWVVVYLGGGTRTALPHVFYIPILLAALPFGVTGGLVVGMAAMVLCGPLMPLDVAGGTPQSLHNWLARGAFFMAIGGLAGATVRWMRRSYQLGLAEHLRQEVQAADPSMAGERPDMTDRIRVALTQDGFHVVFQPIYALDDGRLVAVEALTRFQAEPSEPPDVWFAQAAAIGLGGELELAAIDRALAAAADDLAPGIMICVNASPQTLADPRLLELLDRHDGRTIAVEVTEHAVVDDYDLLETARTELRVRGVRLAVDDAGAGFASLRHIVRLAPDIIKLDPSLTGDVRLDPFRQALADCLIRFAQQTRRELIAEGIEDAADLLTWRRLGAHAAQGYLLARPGPLPPPDRFDLDAMRATRRRNLQPVT